jgi:hypothetical protein
LGRGLPANLSAFVRSLEAGLQLRGAAFDLPELIRYSTDVSSMVRDNPDPAPWARAFVKGRRIVEKLREANGPL